MPEKPFVYINPDGSQSLGLCLIIEYPTGVEYGTQCAGLACDQRFVEGYLIPLGEHDLEKELRDFFWKEFEGQFQRIPWTPALVGKLKAIIERIPDWWCVNSTIDDDTEQQLLKAAEESPGGLDDVLSALTMAQLQQEQRAFLKLDETRLDECTEAWVPVISLHGKGILIFENSD